MKRLFIAAALILSVVSGTHAQSVRSWVSNAGDDANSCSPTAPCRTFAGAILKTATGGIVSALNQGVYGLVNITKGVSLDGTGVLASVLHPLENGVVVKAPTGASVNLRALTVSGSPPVVPGVYGIYFMSGASLLVEDTKIEDQLSVSGAGIFIRPIGKASITIRNVQINNATRGIVVVLNGQNLNISLENVSISGGSAGLVIDGDNGGFARVSIKNSTFSNLAGSAISASSINGNIRLYIDETTMVNSGKGLVASGPNVIGWMGETMIAGNQVGVERTFNASMMSFENNYIYNNTVNGTPLPQSTTPIGDAPPPAQSAFSATSDASANSLSRR